MRSCLYQPVQRDGRSVGVLMVAWGRSGGAAVGRGWPTCSTLLAAEAAVAIERADLLARLEAIARTDDLTGLANRRAWDELLPTELARAARDGAPLCVAMLDLDRFKAYNDEHGHQAGDRLLKAAAGAWRGVAARHRRAGPLRRRGVRRSSCRAATSRTRWCCSRGCARPRPRSRRFRRE